MPDLEAKFDKMKDRYVAPGERVLAVTASNPKGTFRAGMLSQGRQVKRHAAAVGSRLDGQSLAGSLPSQNLWLVLTDQRLMALETTGLFKAGEVLVEFGPEQVIGISPSKKLMAWVADLTFADGSVHKLEMMRSAKPDGFFTALNAWARDGAQA